MARPLRLQAAGAHYHVGARGIDKAPVFLSDEDHDRFLVLLSDVVDRCGWRCHAYCLMPNHYHLVLSTERESLSKGMHRLNFLYAQRFNRRHGRVGHLFQNRFSAYVIESDAHLVSAILYVGDNPVRAGLAERPADWPWMDIALL